MTTAQHRRRAFTLRDLLAVIGVLCVLAALLMPAIQSARETSRETQCIRNLKLLGLALLNFEDKHGVLPPITSNIDSVPDVPGDATAGPLVNGEAGSAATPAAGYSWMVHILYDINEPILFQQIVLRTQNRLETPAFSPNINTGSPSSPHAATTQVVTPYQCPSSAGATELDTSPRTAGGRAAVETGTLPPNYSAAFATANGAKGVSITNYNAMLGTHIDQISKSAPLSNNGGMLYRAKKFGQGRRLAELTDGTSKVPLVCETREQRFSSWYDGTMNWVVAARHSDLTPAANPLANPVSVTTAAMQVSVEGVPLPENRLIIGTDGTSKTGGTALNYGPTPTTPTAVYLPSGSLSDPDISSAPPGRLWGPSSVHRNGIVNHVFADGHVESISDAIEPNLYLWIVTRNSGEPYFSP